MAIIPRIAVVVFRFSQALLISRAIRFVTHFSAASDESGAYWLVVEATAVYVGMAVSVLHNLCLPRVPWTEGLCTGFDFGLPAPRQSPRGHG